MINWDSSEAGSVSSVSRSEAPTSTPTRALRSRASRSATASLWYSLDLRHVTRRVTRCPFESTRSQGMLRAFFSSSANVSARNFASRMRTRLAVRRWRFASHSWREVAWNSTPPSMMRAPLMLSASNSLATILSSPGAATANAFNGAADSRVTSRRLPACPFARLPALPEPEPEEARKNERIEQRLPDVALHGHVVVDEPQHDGRKDEPVQGVPAFVAEPLDPAFRRRDGQRDEQQEPGHA